MEHRLGERKELERRVLLRTLHGLISEGRVIDISLSGLAVRCSLRLAPYTRVFVHFAQPDDSPYDTARWVHGIMVRQLDGGLAVEWADFAPEEVRLLLAAGARKEHRELRREVACGPPVMALAPHFT